MRKAFVVLAFVSLGLTAAGTLPADATEAETLNNQVSGTLSTITPVTSVLCPSQSADEIPYQPETGGPGVLRAGSCQLTYRTTTIVDQFVTIYTYDVAGAFEIVTPGGDIVRGDIAGTHRQHKNPGKTTYADSLSLTVRSGTGQFRGATGTVALEDDYSFGGTGGPGGRASGSLTGALTPGSK